MFKILEIILPFFSEVLSIRKKTKRKLEKHIPYIKIIGLMLIVILLVSCVYLARFAVKASVLVYKNYNAVEISKQYKEDLEIAHRVNLGLIDALQAVAKNPSDKVFLAAEKAKITNLVNQLSDDASLAAIKAKHNPTISESIKAIGEAARASASAAQTASTPAPSSPDPSEPSVPALQPPAPPERATPSRAAPAPRRPVASASTAQRRAERREHLRELAGRN